MEAGRDGDGRKGIGRREVEGRRGRRESWKESNQEVGGKWRVKEYGRKENGRKEK